MLSFLIKALFFADNAKEAISHTDYTGSVHIGVDTAAGDYLISSTSNNSSEMVYGIRNDERHDFSIVTYTNNQVIQLEKGQHLIVYKANLTPIDDTQHEQLTSEIDDTLETVTGDLSTMIKLTNQHYNMPYVIAPNGENPYVELYDQDVNVTNLMPITSEKLITIAPSAATYIKLNDVTSYPLADYPSTGQVDAGVFSPAVYVAGTNIESGDFMLSTAGDNCQYRIIDNIESVAKTPLLSCPPEPRIFTLNDGQVIEFSNAKLEKYYGNIDSAEYEKADNLS